MGLILDSIRTAALNEQSASDLMDVAGGINRRHLNKTSWKPWAGLGAGGALGAGIGAAAGGGSGAGIGAMVGGLGGMLTGALLGSRDIEKGRKIELGERFKNIDTELIDDAMNRKQRSAAIGTTVGALGVGAIGALIGAKYKHPQAMELGAYSGALAGGLGGYGIGKRIGGSKDKEKAIRMLISQS